MTATAERRVSVCVLTYNHARYIRDCLQSIVEQDTDFAFEIIVSDDCSTDGTSAIVNEFADRFPDLFRPVLRPRNIGGTQNFIELHNLANAPYVAHIDGDDLMLPGKLQKQVDFLDANPDFSVVWHRVNLFDDAGGFVSGENYDLSFFPDGVVTVGHALRIGSVAAHSSIMYRKCHRKTTHANFEVLDMFYTWEYLSGGRGKILNEVLGSYRVAAQGSAQLKSLALVQKITVHHIDYFLHRLPEQRRNIFVLSFLNLLFDVRHWRGTAWSFARLTIQSASFVSPLLILRTIVEKRRLPPCSPMGVHDIARMRAKKRFGEA
jgi:glycosyltransferase involved in cell wall biosynthesis